MAFYANVLSNDNENTFKNSASVFTNSFPGGELSLYDDCECALSSITFQQHVKQPVHEEAILDIFDFEYQNGDGTYGKWHKETLDVNSYSNGIELCNVLNMMFWKNIKRLRKEKEEIFSFCPLQSRLWVCLKPEFNVLALLQADLLKICGAESTSDVVSTSRQYLSLGRSKKVGTYDTWTLVKGKREKQTRRFSPECNQRYFVEEKGRTYFTLAPSISTSQLNEVLVFVDIIKPQIIGGKLEKILKFIQLDRQNDGKQVTLTYGSNRNYVPLQRNNFSELSIKLVNSKFIPIQLEGVTRVELHIRRKQV